MVNVAGVHRHVATPSVLPLRLFHPLHFQAVAGLQVQIRIPALLPKTVVVVSKREQLRQSRRPVATKNVQAQGVRFRGTPFGPDRARNHGVGTRPTRGQV